MIYRNIVFPALCAWSKDDAERAHELGIKALRFLGKVKPLHWTIRNLLYVEGISTTVWGIKFPSPFGLAAGFDKNAEAIHGLEALGFGFVEIGTVVPLPQAGNPRPRMFRLLEDRALINRMGFNSHGLDFVVEKLKEMRRRGISIPIGVNVGKNKDTPIKDAAGDYAKGIAATYAYADYQTINPSSPNTADLRTLQEAEALTALLDRVNVERDRLMVQHGKKPLLVKFDPDMPLDLFASALDVVQKRTDGVIIANTTTQFPSTLRSKHRMEKGGLSGRLNLTRVGDRIKFARQHLPPKFPIVAAGGAGCPDSFKYYREEVGADLIQGLTEFVFGGPGVPWRVNSSLIQPR